MTYDLVSLQNEDEYNFILYNDWSKLYTTWKEQFAIWIGLNDLEKEDRWEWSDGSALEYPIPYQISSYPPWQSGPMANNIEPNNLGVK